MKHNIQKKRLIAILVIFKPDLINFKKVVLQHEKNFNSIILVNNSPEISLKTFQSKITSIIYNDDNVGLAVALNIGILEAKKRGAEMVALFDQDSMLPNNFCKRMLQLINSYHDYKNTAVFSPIYLNKITNVYGSIINFKPFQLIRTQPNKFLNVSYPKYVITSSSFIPIKAIDKVGLMREELFIDFIDIEWCLRARSYGYSIVSFSKVEIEHYLGDSSVKFMGKNYPIHSPLRMYYNFRNSLYLYRLKEIDINWRIIDATRNLFRVIFYMVLVGNRITYIKYIFKGYFHGLIKKMGKLEE